MIIFDPQLNDLFSDFFKQSKDIKQGVNIKFLKNRLKDARQYIELLEETIERLSKELNQEKQARSDNELELLTLREEVKNQEEIINNLIKGL